MARIARRHPLLSGRRARDVVQAKFLRRVWRWAEDAPSSAHRAFSGVSAHV
ncbi:hypothetical protein HMPREF1155_1600 [Slackia sp. CM382]|nr:hypothetical protein HMPREF1155_1600 [Slackia sp. CM382]